MNYTQGKFDRNEVLSMEEEIVSSLGSYIYPPTAGSFCLMFLGKFPCDSAPVSAVIETCQFMMEIAACDHFFVEYRQSSLAVAALVVTMEQMSVSPETIKTWLSNIESVFDFAKDLETMTCAKQLRKIYGYNEMRIREIDGDCNAFTTVDKSDRKRVCRAATPSPTPEDAADYEANITGEFTRVKRDEEIQRHDKQCSDNGNDLDGGQRKRQRYGI